MAMQVPCLMQMVFGWKGSNQSATLKTTNALAFRADFATPLSRDSAISSTECNNNSPQ